MSNYFRNVKDAFATLSEGLKLTFGYLVDARKSRTPIGIENEHYFDIDKGIVTLQYPHESLPVPDNARYRLHNEIDDCIVCDKCAKVCPVDCIEIDAIRAPETFGMTSDGTAKRIHAAKFDIDMAKCCFCGLCTTVCPTECLTMTKVYDFSEFDVNDHVYSFSTMTLADIAQKRKELADFEAAKAATTTSKEGENVATKLKPAVRPNPVSGKPAMKPKAAGAKPVLKPTLSKKEDGMAEEKATLAGAEKPRPVMKKPIIKSPENASETEKEDVQKPLKPVMKKPVVKPKIQAKSKESNEEEPQQEKPKFRPRPVMRKKPKDENGDE